MTARDDFDPQGQFRHRKDKVNGTVLHSVVGGDGPPVLLLHGWPQTWWQWRKIMPALARGRRVIAADLRGFGDSAAPPPEAGYDVASLCGDLVELLDRLEHDQAAVVGHDLGGLVAYGLARLHPDRVSHLALMDAPLPIYGLKVPAWAEIEKQLWHQRFHKVPWLAEALIAGRERTYLAWHFAQTVSDPSAIGPEDLDEYVRAYSRPGGLGAGFAFSRAAEVSAKQVEAASGEKLAIPLLFLGGEDSLGDVFEAHLDQIATDARVEVVPGSGHWMAEENPQFVSAALIAFLQGAATTFETVTSAEQRVH